MVLKKKKNTYRKEIYLVTDKEYAVCIKGIEYWLLK